LERFVTPLKMTLEVRMSKHKPTDHRLGDYTVPWAFKPGKTEVREPAVPFRIRDDEFKVGQVPKGDGPKPVLPKVAAWPVAPPLTLDDPMSTVWSTIPVDDYPPATFYTDGWAFVCLSVWSLDVPAIERRLRDLALTRSQGAAVVLHAPRKVVRHFGAVHLETGTLVGTQPVLDQLCQEVRLVFPGVDYTHRKHTLARVIPAPVVMEWLAAAAKARCRIGVEGVKGLPVEDCTGTLEPAVVARKLTWGEGQARLVEGEEESPVRVFGEQYRLEKLTADATLAGPVWERTKPSGVVDAALMEDLTTAVWALALWEAATWAAAHELGSTQATITPWVRLDLEGPAAPQQLDLQAEVVRVTMEASGRHQEQVVEVPYTPPIPLEDLVALAEAAARQVQPEPAQSPEPTPEPAPKGKRGRKAVP
jgi:hypothetical protein